MNKITSILVVGYLYKTLKRKWKEHPLYKVGVIDENGNQLIKKDEMNEEQKKAYSILNIFSWKMKKILEKNPVIKTAILGILMSSILLKESKEGKLVIVNNQLGVDVNNDYHSQYGTKEVVLESGSVIVDENDVITLDMQQLFTLFNEDMNVTTNVEMPKKVIHPNTKNMKPILRKLGLRRSKCTTYLNPVKDKNKYPIDMSDEYIRNMFNNMV